jgi:hypothetical protein
MKTTIILLFSLISISAWSQGLIGTWQLIEEKTCFSASFEKSNTEKELEQSMGKGSRTSVAKIIRFTKKGSGEEGIFVQGKRKGTGLSSFKYSVKDKELQLMDSKSGILTQRFVIDELTESALKIRDAVKECEVKTFSRVK